MVGAIKGGRVISRSGQLFARLSVVVALIAAFSASGCGRKAGLDPPPASAVSDPIAGSAPQSGAPLGLDDMALQSGAPVRPDRTPPPPPGPTLPPPQAGLTYMPETAPPPPAGPSFGPDGKPVPPKTAEKKWFFLDWLVD